MLSPSNRSIQMKPVPNRLSTYPKYAKSLLLNIEGIVRKLEIVDGPYTGLDLEYSSIHSKYK